MTNWLGGGSVYMPAKDGKNVPIELSLAIHSDAGYNPDGKSVYGSLAICTTNFNDEKLNTGISRFTSKDFAQALLKNLVTDMRYKYGDLENAIFGTEIILKQDCQKCLLPSSKLSLIRVSQI